MITINGKTYKGNNLSMSGGKILIDGKEVSNTDEFEEKEVYIAINGSLETLEVDTCNEIVIGHNCGQVKTTNGNVSVNGDIEGDVKTTNGNVLCSGGIKGRIATTNGSVSGKSFNIGNIGNATFD